MEGLGRSGIIEEQTFTTQPGESDMKQPESGEDTSTMEVLDPATKAREGSVMEDTATKIDEDLEGGGGSGVIEEHTSATQLGESDCDMKQPASKEDASTLENLDEDAKACEDFVIKDASTRKSAAEDDEENGHNPDDADMEDSDDVMSGGQKYKAGSANGQDEDDEDDNVDDADQEHSPGFGGTGLEGLIYEADSESGQDEDDEDDDDMDNADQEYSPGFGGMGLEGQKYKADSESSQDEDGEDDVMEGADREHPPGFEADCSTDESQGGYDIEEDEARSYSDCEVTGRQSDDDMGYDGNDSWGHSEGMAPDGGMGGEETGRVDEESSEGDDVAVGSILRFSKASNGFL